MADKLNTPKTGAGGVVSLSELRSALAAHESACKRMAWLSSQELQILQLRIARQRVAMKRIKEGESIRGKRRQLLDEKCRLKEMEYQQAERRLENFRLRWRRAMPWTRKKSRRWKMRLRGARRERRKQYRQLKKYQRLAEKNQACIGRGPVSIRSQAFRQHLGICWQLENKKRVLHLKLQHTQEELFFIDFCMQQLRDFYSEKSPDKNIDKTDQGNLSLPNSDLNWLLRSGELARIIKDNQQQNNV